MSTGNSSGETGRCDAKCYNADHPSCNCCCGGRNHGVGLPKAIENTNNYANEMIKEWKAKHPDEHFIVENLLF
jgi:hypothetical protein